MLKIGKKSLKKNNGVFFHQGNAEKLKFQNNYFDILLNFAISGTRENDKLSKLEKR